VSGVKETLKKAFNFMKGKLATCTLASESLTLIKPSLLPSNLAKSRSLPKKGESQPIVLDHCQNIQLLPELSVT